MSKPKHTPGPWTVEVLDTTEMLSACKAAAIQAPGWRESIKAAIARAEGRK